MHDIAYGNAVCSEYCDDLDFVCNHPECRNYKRRGEEPERKCRLCGYKFGYGEDVFHFGENYYHVDCFEDVYMETLQ